ncbi:MAG TPA: hypothetical protein VL049_10765 [Candidatus Dormibacteraeota bacterium]|nr:hypothetical protein [Candidatus Dormibacteraeota bacterium]
MTVLREQAIRDANCTRYRPGQTAGHYESFFLRANHPTRPLAFWIRYTIYSPDGRPADGLGELWAIVFDGESARHVAVKREVPLAGCRFASSGLGVEVDGARLDAGRLTGEASRNGHTLAWDLTFRGKAAPLFLLPLKLYATKLPRAKSLVALPMAVFDGALTVDGRALEVASWIGSQNHNWGSRHTDHYAWGQVAGFDTHPDSFLEVATARLRFGRWWTPSMTPIVLRHRGEEIAMNRLGETLCARAQVRYFEWTFAAESRRWRLDGRIAAPRSAFVGLRYYNPPGGTKYCLNSKLAACEITLTDKRTAQGGTEVLSTAHRAAFEILTDDATEHGMPLD